MKAFHAYDIRGIFGKDFSLDDVYKIGYYLPELLGADKVLVGRDCRVSSPAVFEALSRGITDAGADVVSAGLSTTPMIYWATAKYGFKASVMITASHNPKEYNGMKISRSQALPVGYDTGLKMLEERVLSAGKIVPQGKKGTITEKDFKKEYLDFHRQFVTGFSNLNISIDASNGMAALLVKDLYGDLPHYINDTLDGNFPAHDPNPLVQENVRQLIDTVQRRKSDIGIIYDGDADRVMFVDEKGRFVPPDLIIALLGHHFLQKEKGKVLQDIRTSKSVKEYLEPMGAEIVMWRVGRAYAAPKLREINGIYGGELAGHYYFRQFFYSDSALMTSSIVLGLIADFKRKGVKFSQIIDRIKTYANSGEVNFRLENKKQAMEAVKDYFSQKEKPLAFYDFDGYRIEFKDWWFNIRPSNTEPYLRLIVEAKNEDLLNEKLKEIQTIINNFK